MIEYREHEDANEFPWTDKREMIHDPIFWYGLATGPVGYLALEIALTVKYKPKCLVCNKTIFLPIQKYGFMKKPDGTTNLIHSDCIFT